VHGGFEVDLGTLGELVEDAAAAFFLGFGEKAFVVPVKLAFFDQIEGGNHDGELDGASGADQFVGVVAVVLPAIEVFSVDPDFALETFELLLDARIQRGGDGGGRHGDGLGLGYVGEGQ
jgi:hypothetical protein